MPKKGKGKGGGGGGGDDAISSVLEQTSQKTVLLSLDHAAPSSSAEQRVEYAAAVGYSDWGRVRARGHADAGDRARIGTLASFLLRNMADTNPQVRRAWRRKTYARRMTQRFRSG